MFLNIECILKEFLENGPGPCLVGDVNATISALLPKLNIKADRFHLDQSLANYRNS